MNQGQPTTPNAPATHARRPRANATPRRAILAALIAATLAPLTGCLENDGWLWDPSVIGRWENTPTVTPILDRIDVIERDTGDFVDPTPVRPEDLIPQSIDYRVEPGDFLEVTIFDLEATGVPSLFQLPIDNRGFITIPRIGTVEVSGRTATGVGQAVADELVRQNILPDPTVSVTVPGRRQATFGIYGNIAGVGRYQVPYPDYRLLDAITDAGGIPPSVRNIYIIRQVEVSELDPNNAPDLSAPSNNQPRPTGNGPSPDPRPSIDDILQRLAEPQDGTAPSANTNDINPAAFPATNAPRSATPTNNTNLSARLQQLADEVSQPAFNAAHDHHHISPSAFQPTDQPAGTNADRTSAPANPAPAIDLPDSSTFNNQQQPDNDTQADPTPIGEWEFIDGRWLRVVRAPAPTQTLPDSPDPLAATPDDTLALVTQRVIEVPAAPLQRGIAKFNVVIRPGDLISLPIDGSGLYYMAGPGINRPGTYNISPATEVTLLRAIAAANGISSIGIPERVDLTRRVGTDSQATIRLNVRAIAEGTAPDILLKPDDLLNFGTNFWATPLAVIRNGFRATYGFGFLLDRNFGNDVFGAPPSNVGG